MRFSDKTCGFRCRKCKLSTEQLRFLRNSASIQSRTSRRKSGLPAASPRGSTKQPHVGTLSSVQRTWRGQSMCESRSRPRALLIWLNWTCSFLCKACCMRCANMPPLALAYFGTNFIHHPFTTIAKIVNISTSDSSFRAVSKQKLATRAQNERLVLQHHQALHNHRTIF